VKKFTIPPFAYFRHNKFGHWVW